MKYNSYNTIEHTIVTAMVDLFRVAVRVLCEKIVFGVESSPEVAVFSLIFPSCSTDDEFSYLYHRQVMLAIEPAMSLVNSKLPWIPLSPKVFTNQ